MRFRLWNYFFGIKSMACFLLTACFQVSDEGRSSWYDDYDLPAGIYSASLTDAALGADGLLHVVVGFNHYYTKSKPSYYDDGRPLSRHLEQRDFIWDGKAWKVASLHNLPNWGGQGILLDSSGMGMFYLENQYSNSRLFRYKAGAWNLGPELPAHRLFSNGANNSTQEIAQPIEFNSDGLQNGLLEFSTPGATAIAEMNFLFYQKQKLSRIRLNTLHNINQYSLTYQYSITCNYAVTGENLFIFTQVSGKGTVYRIPFSELGNDLNFKVSRHQITFSDSESEDEPAKPLASSLTSQPIVRTFKGERRIYYPKKDSLGYLVVNSDAPHFVSVMPSFSEYMLDQFRLDSKGCAYSLFPLISKKDSSKSEGDSVTIENQRFPPAKVLQTVYVLANSCSAVQDTVDITSNDTTLIVDRGPRLFIRGNDEPVILSIFRKKVLEFDFSGPYIPQNTAQNAVNLVLWQRQPSGWKSEPVPLDLKPAPL